LFGVDKVGSLPNAASAVRFMPVDGASVLDCKLSLLFVLVPATSSFGTEDVVVFLRMETGGETISFGLLGTGDISGSRRRALLLTAHASDDVSLE